MSTPLFTANAYDLDDYLRMFKLNNDQLNSRILDVHSSLSCFNAQMQQHKHHHVTSIDPLYSQTLTDIQAYLQAQTILLSDAIASQQNPMAFKPAVLQYKLDTFRAHSKVFLKDIQQGFDHKRYISHDVKESALPFDDYSYDIALCSHWLFAQTDSIDQCIHIIEELARVAGEVRIFPLLNHTYEPSENVAAIMALLQNKDYQVACIDVTRAEHLDGNALLCIVKESCHIKS